VWVVSRVEKLVEKKALEKVVVLGGG